MKILKLIKAILKDILPSSEFLQCGFGVMAFLIVGVLLQYIMGQYIVGIIVNIICYLAITILAIGTIIRLCFYISDKWNNLD